MRNAAPLQMPPFKLTGYSAASGFSMSPANWRGVPCRAWNRYFHVYRAFIDRSGQPTRIPMLRGAGDYPVAWTFQNFGYWAGLPVGRPFFSYGAYPEDFHGPFVARWLAHVIYGMYDDGNLIWDAGNAPISENPLGLHVTGDTGDDEFPPFYQHLTARVPRTVIISVPASFGPQVTNDEIFAVSNDLLFHPFWNNDEVLPDSTFRAAKVIALLAPQLSTDSHEYLLRMGLPHSSFKTVTDTPRLGFPFTVRVPVTTAGQWAGGEILYIDVLESRVQTYAGVNTVFVPGSAYVNGSPQGTFYELGNQVNFSTSQFKRDAGAYVKVGYHSVLFLQPTAAVNGWAATGRAQQKQHFADTMQSCAPFGASYRVFDQTLTKQSVYDEVRAKVWSFFELGTP